MNIIGRSALVLAALSLLVLAGAAGADEKTSGTVKSIDLETRTIIIDTHNGPDVAITISEEDTATLNKFKTKLIKVDDEVRVKYVVKDGKNVATVFRKTAGC
jgi:Cu/Ag efflux protein CusF